MIEASELKNAAEIKGLSVKNCEKDYLLELFLYLLYKETGKDLVFKGGTALYKIYSLNRFSEDLDFTLNSNKIKLEELLNKVIRKLRDININAKVKNIDDYKNQKNIKIELRGPLFDGSLGSLSLITINSSLKERTINKPEQKMIFSKYADIISFDVFSMPLDEIFAEKVRAIMTRDKPRDVYDLWFLLKKGVNINLKNINIKLKLYNKKFEERIFFDKIYEKEKMWERDLNGLIIGDLPKFRIVVKYIKQFFES